ncbi:MULTISPECIES: iron ABC transporter substrate-binding protein [Rhizobium]|uniref:Iron ABC transporter substrate-binding protein n=1 Tax=Rhizobium rhododendri TaxID=2506430 RepID=A0ABY8IHL6_9HYPH|nr:MULTISPECIES: iron ABC transporter substrate-binding protein [Rhizobium]MBO9096728.1 iron ABC transporter substrate-binding protein [Rhizobium sp. L58/93]MBO9134399.1 iron ABC transporter substrate-binding protein [Rhizobium sp. B209b/85]MBO9166983.1 iron ABC transporter substrate-binding protein [Rhizobium sp. L245/93]MBO9182955.1 iron ABC transporter substrate-binding protein [Rhizobium sp. E27B/91]MBZ5763469.1 iron ABC transporter substrate-binding protein [Rhizobium sp. VS19-DR96]
MKFSRSFFAGLTLACATAAGPLAVSLAHAQDDGIVVYNAQHETLTQAWAEGFTKDTGIKVTVRNGSDMQFANQIIEEGAASPADVFLTENSPAMVLVDAAGLFAPIDADTLAQLPETFKAADGKWTGVAARTTVFAYDKTKLKEADLPKSMMDLADPKWKGRWGASPGGADFQAIVSAFLELKGEAETAKWLKALKENATSYKGNSVAMKAVNAGEIEGALIYHYYWFGDQAKTGENSKNVALHYFKNQDPGAFVSISGGAVLASSQHQKEAQAFIKWITGKGGQTVLRDGNSFEYAVGNGAQSNPKLVPLAELQAPKIEPSKLNSKKVTDLMTAAGLI